jgi:hypothetical protein
VVVAAGAGADGVAIGVAAGGVAGAGRLRNFHQPAAPIAAASVTMTPMATLLERAGAVAAAFAAGWLAGAECGCADSNEEAGIGREEPAPDDGGSSFGSGFFLAALSARKIWLTDWLLA